MSNQPQTIRELCEKATKGPWQDNSLGDYAGAVYQVPALGANPVCSTCFHLPRESACNKETHANAQLIARFSPDVVMAVVERAERIASYDVPDAHEMIRLAKEILRLLNGQTESRP